MKLFSTGFLTPKQDTQQAAVKPATMFGRDAKAGVLSPPDRFAKSGSITTSGEDHSEGSSGSSQ